MWLKSANDEERKKEWKKKKNPSTVSNNAPRTNERMSLEITKPFEYSLGIWYTKYLPKNDSWICFCVSNRCVCDHKIDLRYSNHRRSDKENFFSVWEIWLCVLECGRRACFIYQCGCRECRSLGGYRYIFIVSHQFISHRIRRQYTHIYIFVICIAEMPKRLSFRRIVRKRISYILPSAICWSIDYWFVFFTA